MKNLKSFLLGTNSNIKTELEKILFISFFQQSVLKVEDFELAEMCQLLVGLGYAKPNSSRLKQKLLNSRTFIKSSPPNRFKLHPREFEKLSKEFPELGQKSEEIISTDTIIPEGLYNGTRGYIVNLSKQINASFEHNLYDACAVLMRRTMEILLIHSFQNLGRVSEIEDSNGSFKNLNSIINYTISNKVLTTISKETEETLEEFRILGNFSAHKIHYNAKKGDIEKVRLKFRLMFEELLYTSGIKK